MLIIQLFILRLLNYFNQNLKKKKLFFQCQMISFEKNKVIKINVNFFWNVLDRTRDFETKKVIFAIP